MSIRCHPNYFIRRRRHYIVNISFIILCFGLFLLIKYKFIKSLPTTSFLNTSLCTKLLFNKTTLNCSGDPLGKWCKNEMNLCDSSLIIYNKLFAITHSVILQPKFAKGKRLGGENIQDVLNQAENDEYFQFDNGFIKLPCEKSVPNGIFSHNSHLSNVFSSVTSYKACPSFHLINETTIAVNRQDYVNIYHTITDLYTVYLLCRFFQRDPKSVRILFLDAHPKGNLDIFWSQLFHSYTRLGRLNYSSIYYKELIWSQPQFTSEIDIQKNRRIAPSFFSDFRQYILKEFNIKFDINENLNCQTLNLFFLLRRNYVAHPRNPTGKITRQLTNEQQILNDLKNKFSNFSTINFTFGYFEQLTIEQQLNIIIQTDIFIGIHGAGLTHVLFLKPNRTLIELATTTWKSQTHFQLMASINFIKYRRCLITDGQSTTAQTIFDCIIEKLFQMCPSSNISTDNNDNVKTVSMVIENTSNNNNSIKT